MAVTTRPDGVTVVDDAYNANPESMAAALRAVAGLSGARRWAVLGEMRELGPDAERLHREVGEAAARLGFDHVVAVGAEPIAAGARAVPGWRGEALLVADAAEATRLLAERVRGDDVVLVKASNAARLWEVAEALVPAAAGTQQGVGS
jgi:UDP-N-acetylmuramoyl-tripeptide--D-alanyl-D-alanine ligase